MSDKYFPIRTATSCQLKWAWSTIFLNSGVTRSCHRTADSELTSENFFNFHNTPLKLSDRKMMLDGKWPETSCSYCREIEGIGGVSDRMRQQTIPNLTPIELNENPEATVISPSIVEVYFNNACNLGCLYCDASFSSTIETENKEFGNFESHGIKIIPSPNHFKDLVPLFWQWFPEGFIKVKRLHILGGEPFYQKELDKLLDMIEKYPNPDCELNIVTNLMVPKKRIEGFVNRFKQLLTARKLKRVDITCSIDCWGVEQEYVRWGLKLDPWEENFKLLLDNKWLYLNINQTISALTIKTMPALLTKLAIWRKDRQLGHWFSGVTPGPSYLKGEIFGKEEFADTVDEVLKLMPMTTEEDKSAYQYMDGILTQVLAAEQNLKEITKLLVYLNEKDRRRNTDWRQTFPWLIKYEALCGIRE